MPIGLVSPGTKVREVDLTQGRIDNVTITTGAFVAPFAKGPVEDPIFIESEQRLIDTFGKPSENDNQYEYWMSASNYLTYGGIMRMVRSDGSNLKNANAGIGVSNVALKIKNFEDYQSNYTTASTWYWAAKDPGSWSNDLKVCVIDAMADQIITGVNTANKNVRVGAAVTQELDTVVAGVGTTSILDGYLLGLITEIGKDQISVKIVSHVSVANTGVAVNYTERGAYAFKDTDTVGIGSTCVGVGFTNPSVVGIITTFTPASVLDWYDEQQLGLVNSNLYWKEIAEKPKTSAYASSRDCKNDEIHVAIIDDKGTISGTPGTILEKFVNLSKAIDATSATSGPIFYKDFLATNSNYIFPGDAPIGEATGYIELTAIASNSGVSTTSNGDSVWGLAAQGATFNGVGRQTYTLTGGNNYGTNDESNPRFTVQLGELMSGYELFRNKREYPVNFLIQGPGYGTKEQTQAKANKLIDIAEARKDVIACISPQRSAVLVDSGIAGSTPAPIVNTNTQTNNVISFFDAVTSSSYAVFDTGYKYQFDRFSNKFRYVPLNPDIAGIMCRTGVNDWPWYSPGGVRRGVVNNAVKLAFNPSQAQRDLLYPRRINSVIFSPGGGIILFGDKTGLGVASAFDRINVRRLFITIEDAIERASRAFLFEFNDALTRANFINVVEPYLRDVQAKRGIQDFVVICDETNNTPDIIDSNEFIADIYIKPARSINFICLTFIATRTGVSFEEVIGRFG
jgi:hypothetical protein